MHQRAALDTREYCLVEIVFFSRFFACKNQTAPGASQRLVGGGGNHIRIGNRARVKPGSHKAGNVSHIHHQNRTCFVGYLPEFLKINGSCIGGRTCYDHLGLAFQSNFPEHIVVQEPLVIYAIRHDLKIFPGDIYRASVGQVPAVIQVHSHDGIAGTADCKLYCQIGLSS